MGGLYAIFCPTQVTKDGITSKIAVKESEKTVRRGGGGIGNKIYLKIYSKSEHSLRGWVEDSGLGRWLTRKTGKLLPNAPQGALEIWSLFIAHST